ncbi:uncharacterized protein LOC125229082 [Leguminivora glycinivorella]|uniref:uncharacterized protein LOC125229082 n=1 Tax=Leguminivora glycinivorella TaxID=1035111 RepID=UPI00200D9ECD|nr:uncharacterized protein LOC125229082 [Leguminivora glycinivorella]
MNNDLKIFSSTNYRNEHDTGEVMRNSLFLISKEIQKYSRFTLEPEIGKDTMFKNDADIDFNLENNTNATKADIKNRQFKKLKEHLKTVCNIAKIVLSAKNKETENLLNQLKTVRNESYEISKSNAENLSLIQQLRMENYNISSDVQFLSNFIHKAYQKLQKMRNEIPKDMPFIEELKTILLACGEYYVDYCNARDQCAQLKQRNRFLRNKLNIVENNLAATTEELRNLRNINKKLKMKCEIHHKNGDAFSKNDINPSVDERRFNITALGDGNKSDHYRYNARIPKDVECKQNFQISNKSPCLTSHLETVNNLILDQDNMLKELKELYLEVRQSCIFE